MTGCDSVIVEPGFEFAEYSVQQVVAFELGSIMNLRHSLNTGFCSKNVGQGDRPIQGNHWRVVYLDQTIIQG